MGLMPKSIWYLRHRVFSRAYIRVFIFLVFCLLCCLVGVYGYAGYAAAQSHSLHRGKSPVDDLDAFYLSFAKQSELTEVLGRIHDAAPRHGLILPEGDLRAVLISDSKRLVVQTLDQSLYRYSVSLKLRGSVRSVTEYVIDVMRTDVGVGLLSLTLVGDGKSSADSEYLLGFEIYLSSNEHSDSAEELRSSMGSDSQLKN